jgi:hypothetical protein
MADRMMDPRKILNALNGWRGIRLSVGLAGYLVERACCRRKTTEAIPSAAGKACCLTV